MNMKSIVKPGVFLMTALAASISASVAHAQDGSGFTLEEIIVTAEKRETSLMDTGISVTAFSSEKLQAKGITSGDDLSVVTPGLSVSNSDRITMRGIGVDTLAFGVDPGVGTYADGYYLRGVGLYRSNNFYDIERIEVLRGPQGTLYGRNTPGGAVNMISKKPEQELAGDINLEAGDYGYTVVQGMLNVPLGEKFAWRVSASKIDRDPLQDNDAGPGIESIDNTSLDTTFSANWTDTWSTDLRLAGYNRKGSPSAGYKLEPHDTTTRAYPGGIGINHTYVPPGGDALVNPTATDVSKTSQDFANTEDEHFDSVLLTNSFDVGNMTVKYIGGYSESKATRALDVDHSSSTYSSSVNHLKFDIKQSSHELQLVSDFDGKINFVAGLYYSKSDEDMYFDYANPANDIYSTPLSYMTEFVGLEDPLYGIIYADTGLNNYLDNGIWLPDFAGDSQNRTYWFDANLEAESKAVFGQMDYQVSDKLELTAGLRYTHDEKTGSENVNAVVPMSGDFFPVPGLSGTGNYSLLSYTHSGFNPTSNSIGYLLTVNDNSTASDSWENVSGMVRAQYTLDNDALLYGSISTGYRSGGFNLGQSDPGVDSFDNEDVTSFEVGYKSVFMDNRASLDVSGYFYDYQNMQVSQGFLDSDTGTAGSEITNAGKAEIAGAEVQLSFLITDQFSVSGSYAFAEAQYTEFDTVDTRTFGVVEEVSLKGNALNRAPKNKFAAGADYLIDLGDMGDLTLGLSYSWVDEMYTDVFNDPRGMTDSWGRTDARATWVASDNITVAAYVKNIEDKRNSTDASLGTLSAGFVRTDTLTDPRTMGIRFNYGF